MIQIPISEVKLGDVGSRAIVTLGGIPVAGTLRLIRSHKTPFGVGKIWASVELADGPGGSEFKLNDLPLDYLIQIDRPKEPEVAVQKPVMMQTPAPTIPKLDEKRKPAPKDLDDDSIEPMGEDD